MLAIKGIYDKGHIQLSESVPYNEKFEVIVTFLGRIENKHNRTKTVKGILSGKYEFTESDFQEAKKIWE